MAMWQVGVTARAAGEGPGAPARLRLLLADDTPAVRYLLRYAFEASSAFEVVAEAGNGQEAVELAERHRPDVVLLDLAMPVMDGLQAIPRLRQRVPEALIVVHSGFAAGRMETRALALGAAAYLEKSHRPDVLVDRVLAVVRQARSVPAAPPPPSRLELAFERAQVGMGLMAPDGRWLRVNRALGHLLGRSVEELLGATLADVTEPSDREAVAWALERMQDGDTPAWETDQRCLHGDGRLLWTHVELAVVTPDGADPYLIALVRDVTERRLAHQQARLCRSLAEAIASAADFERALGLVLAQLCDATGWACSQAWVPNADGSRLVASRAWAATGPGLDEFMADSAERAFTPGLGLPGRVWESGRAAWIDDVTAEGGFPRAAAAAAAGLRTAVAVPITAGDRVVAVVEFFSRERRHEDRRLLRLVTEATAEVGIGLERKQAEDALRASEQRYRAVAEVAPEAIVGADEHGRIVSWNPGAASIFGYEAAEVIGRPLSMLMPERFRAAHGRGMERVRLGGAPRMIGRTVEVSGLRQDGSEFPIELSLGAWRSGSETFFSGIIRDVSERKRVEQALAAARDEAMQAALQQSEFLATVSHEIRTPLNAVVAMTSLLAGAAVDAEQGDWIRTAGRAASAALEIINDILDFSKVEAGHLTLEHHPFDLRAVIHDAVSMVQVEAGRKALDVMVDVDPTFPAVCVGDPRRLRQVLVNLLANAVRFTDSGSVTVRVPPVVVVGDLMTVRLEVADTGVGIAPEHHDALFEPFIQTGAGARRRGGTGLGLAICRQLVTMMGGSIGVESSPGAGSNFWCEVNLRTAEPDTAAGLAAPRPGGPESLAGRPLPLVPAPGPGRACVLVVEDDETSRKVAAVLLRRLGFDVVVAGSGQEALIQLSRAPVDIVLMDCSMPGLDGFATTARIREQEAGWRRTPVVAMTGAAMPGDREHCLRAGMDDYVCKPVTPEELDRVVTRWTEPRRAGAGHRPEGAGDEPPAGPAGSLDWARLDLLRHACSADRPGVLGELIGEYLAAGLERIRGLRAAVAGGDRTEVERLAHMLKGSSATFGAIEVASLSADLEQAARVGSLGAAPEFLAGLAEAFDRAARSLRQSLQSPPTGAEVT